MNKNSDPLSVFEEYKRKIDEIDQKYEKKKISDKKSIARDFSVMGAIVTIISVLTYVGSILIDKSYIFDSKTDITVQRINELESKINNLTINVGQISNLINNNKDLSLSALETKIDSVQSKLDAVNATILFDPEKALTSRLISEKQLRIEEIQSDTNEAMRQLNMRLDTVVFVPIIGGLAAFIIGGLRRTKEEKIL